MNTNRPLSPHFTVYTPQLTSMLSIFHRISGAFMASTLLLGVLGLKFCDLSLSFYPVYLSLFYVMSSLSWILLTLAMLWLLAISYHMSNGIRHLLWDLGLCLNLPQVYSSGIAIVCLAISLAILNFLRIVLS